MIREETQLQEILPMSALHKYKLRVIAIKYFKMDQLQVGAIT